MSHFRKYVHISSNFDQKFAKFDLNCSGRPSGDLQVWCDPNAEGIRVGGKNLVFWLGLWYKSSKNRLFSGYKEILFLQLFLQN